MDVPTLKARVDSLLEKARKGGGDPVARANELLQGALTVMAAFYGPDSHQVTTLREVTEEIRSQGPFVDTYNFKVIDVVVGVLNNLKAELDAGLAGSLQKRMAGDVLTNFIQLARAVLDEPGDNAKNVAAVLAAAAYEDTIRRMGTEFAGVMGRDDLSHVIDALKKAAVLQPPQLGIALSYLNFRNRALHANWEQIDRSAVNSVLGFVEQLLLKHFQ